MTTYLEKRSRLAPLTVPGEDASVLQRWRSVAATFGHRPAVVSSGRAYSFQQVDRRSDWLAAALLARMSDGQDPIGLLLGHDADTLVALLAVVKTGRPVVVLDEHMPSDRLRLIVEMGRMAAVITDSVRAELAHAVAVSVPSIIDHTELPTTDAAHPGLPAPDLSLDDPLSVIFTSGSTGLPKGVIITHGQTLNDGYAIRLAMELTEADRCAAVMPFGFLAGFDFAMASLLCGATTYPIDPRDTGVQGLVDQLRDHEITATFCTPYLARSLASAVPLRAPLETLRTVATAGEAVHGQDVAALRPVMARDGVFVNITGSSEVASFAAFRIEADDPIPTGPVPAGTAVPNKWFHLVDDDDHPVPDGQPGHLVITSPFLSGGYLTNAELTAEKFSIDDGGNRYHRQSDMARISDGILTMLGRDDAAVKVRGYFVDPTEVENAIRDSPSVHETVVVPVKSPDAPTFLAAYVVPNARTATESVATLRRRLRERLPEYMVPATITVLSALPRTERGKVDRVALPPAERRSTGEPPATQWELVVADLWTEMLGIDEMGLDDDFMALGADSLVVEQMLAAAAERFAVRLVTSDLLEAPTLREFSQRVSLGTAALPSHPDVVSLGGRGAGTPVFCFAGAGSLALGFAPIARHLGDRPVYAFQAHGLEKRAVPDKTVEAAADRALQLLRLLQPHGPYVLMGHSFGGLLALEAARRLTEVGETVALVTMLDTFLLDWPSKSVGHTEDLLPTEPVRGKIGALSGRSVRAWLRRVLPVGLPEPGDWGRHFRSRLAGVVRFRGQRQFDAFFDHTVRVARHYRLQPHDGPTLLITTQDYPYGASDWRTVLHGRLDIRAIACEHSSMIREPHALTVATLLEEQLHSRHL